MPSVGLWRVSSNGPKKLKRGVVDLEKHLEDWIEQDPGLLQNGLTIVGRQIIVEGGRLDLLALDHQGRWVVIEIKSGAVRRDTVAQALDYMSCLETIPYAELETKVNTYLRPKQITLQQLLKQRAAEEYSQRDEREVSIYVVGTQQDDGLQRMVDSLSKKQISIAVVTFDVYQIGDELLLMREVTEADIEPQPKLESSSIDRLFAEASENGIGSDFHMMFEAAKSHGLYPHPYKHSLMFAPPSHHGRALFTIWTEPTVKGHLYTFIGPEVFTEFYPISEEKAVELLGKYGYRNMNSADVQNFVENLALLFESMNEQG